jgi:hypothetical protein
MLLVDTEQRELATRLCVSRQTDPGSPFIAQVQGLAARVGTRALADQVGFEIVGRVADWNAGTMISG